MTRVAYVCADPGIPVFGTKGASVHIQEMIRAWRARGAQVEVYAVRLGEDVPADLMDLVVHHVPVGKGADVAEREVAQRAAAAQLAELVRHGEPDVVYERYSLFSTVLHDLRRAEQEGSEPREPGGPGLTLLLEVNAPLVDEQRTHRVLVDEAAAEAALRDQVTAADVVACVSAPVAHWVRERSGVGQHVGHAEEPAVVVVPNGVNTERITAVTPDLTGDPVVVFVGTLKPWHGVEHLLAAAACASVPWRLRVIGDGPQREALAAAAEAAGVPVEFTGALPPEQVPAALEGALVAVAPYPEAAEEDHYFSPLKVYEYGAAALPVVASRIGQIPQVVLHGETGLLVPPSDPAALAAALDTLVADPGRAVEMGARARALMERQHSWTHVLEATLAPTLTAAAPALHPAGAR